jgi:hypothetical protein
VVQKNKNQPLLTMKKVRNILLLFMALLIAAPVLHSCRKGEEDPWFSFYSRKTRLCQDWKVISYKRTEQTNDSIVGYTFNGETYTKIKSNYTYSSPGSMRIIFSKTGSYQWDQTISTDTSDYQYTEKGMWYFAGGSKESSTKTKELLALQKNELTESFSDDSSNSTLSYFGSGDLGTNVFHIRKLSIEGVILESEIKTTYVSLGVNTLSIIKTEIELEPR